MGKMASDLIRFTLSVGLHDIQYLRSAGADDTARVANYLLAALKLTSEEFVFMNPEWMDTSEAGSTPIDTFKDWLSTIGIDNGAPNWDLADEGARKIALGSLATKCKRVYINARASYEKGDTVEADEGEPLSQSENKTLLTLFAKRDGRLDLSEYLPHMNILGKFRRSAQGYMTHVCLVKLVAQTSIAPTEELVVSERGIKRGQNTLSERKFVGDVFDLLEKAKLWATGYRLACIDLTDSDGKPAFSADIMHRYISLITKCAKIYMWPYGCGRLLAMKEDTMRQGMLDKKNGRGYSVGGALECMLNTHEERMLQGPSVQELESIASRSNGKGGKGGKGGDTYPSPEKWQRPAKGKGGSNNGGGKGKGKGLDFHTPGVVTAAKENWTCKDRRPFCLFFNDERGGRGCDAGAQCKNGHFCDLMVNTANGWEPCHGNHSRKWHIDNWGVPK